MVLDDFVDDATRQQLLDFLLHGAGGANGTALGGDQPAARAAAEPAAPCSQQAEEDGQQAAGGTDASDVQLPPGRWERRTTDMAGAAPTWGVKQHVLQELAEGRLPAMQAGGAWAGRRRAACGLEQHCLQAEGRRLRCTCAACIRPSSCCWV